MAECIMYPWERRGNRGAIGELSGRVEYDSKTKHLHAVFTSGATFQIICGNLVMHTNENARRREAA